MIEAGVLKQHHGVDSEFIEYRLLGNLPNGKKERDHKDFELKCGLPGEITLADLSTDYNKSLFVYTHAFNKCKSLVYIPRKKVNGEMVFDGFYHIDESSWYSILDKLETDWKTIIEYIESNSGIENLKKTSSGNYAKTNYLKLFRCPDRISKKGKKVKPTLRLKISTPTLKMLKENAKGKCKIV